jgi:hypothetical protein
MKNKTLNQAKKAKNDEFYTRLEDIENELHHYRDCFKGKVVYCNCDDPRVSNFFHYFSYKFEDLGLKKLIATCYGHGDIEDFGHGDDESAVCIVYEGDKNGNLIPDREEIEVIPLKGNGDFRSPECIEFLKEADIVVTNPPFSLFREFVDLMMEYDKKFLIIGNNNAISYQEIFKYIKENQLWLGYTSPKEFLQPDGLIKKFGNIGWYTNLPVNKRNEKLILVRKYNEKDYPKYDNYDAINVDKVVDIPMDYYGVMGVPITFLDKHCPEQFEIIGITVSKIYKELDGAKGLSEKFVQDYYEGGGTGKYATGQSITGMYKDGKAIIPYRRILIRCID